jgi:hypothetical protein
VVEAWGVNNVYYRDRQWLLCKVRTRGPLRWRAAGKHSGKGGSAGRDGVILLPTGAGPDCPLHGGRGGLSSARGLTALHPRGGPDNPPDDPPDGEREVTTPWHHDGNEYVADERVPRGGI